VKFFWESCGFFSLKNVIAEFKICVFSVKNMGTAKGYMFRVFAHSATSFTSSDEYKYPMPEDIKNRAITAGLVGRSELDPRGVRMLRSVPTNP
jgi:hypothetical protein